MVVEESTFSIEEVSGEVLYSGNNQKIVLCEVVKDRREVIYSRMRVFEESVGKKSTVWKTLR